MLVLSLSKKKDKVGRMAGLFDRIFAKGGSDLGKWQWVRLMDVFLLGPFMILLGYQIRNMVAPWKVFTLIFSGLGTILLNLYFFLVIGNFI